MSIANPFEVSRRSEEYQRRWEHIWSAMESDRIAVLLLSGRNCLSEYGFIQYTTGFYPGHRPSYVLMRRNEPPILFLPHSDHAGIQPDVADGVVVRWETNIITALIQILNGVSDIGIAGISDHWPETAGAIRAVAAGDLVDAATLMHEVKIVKTESDIAGLTHASDLAIHAMNCGSRQVAMGMSHRDIARRFDIAARLGGADLTVTLVGAGAISGQPPTSALARHDDRLTVFVELCLGGYWVEHSTVLDFGFTQPAREESSKAVELLDRAAEFIQIGTRACDVAAFMASEFENAGSKPTMGLGHGVGVDEDWPSIDATDKTVIREDMVLALHPSFVTPTGEGFAAADTFRVRPNGAVSLAPTGPRIIHVPEADR